jgi:hypothetical protein
MSAVKRLGRRERVARKRQKRTVVYGCGSERAPYKLGRKKSLRQLSGLLCSRLTSSKVADVEPRAPASNLERTL